MQQDGSSTTPPQLAFVMQVQVEVAAPLELGEIHGSHQRVVPITGGTFQGPRLRGQVLNTGADWQITRSDDVAVLDARYLLQPERGQLIAVHNRGIRHGAPDLATRIAAGEYVHPSEYYFMTTPVFETAAPELQWLTRSIFIGRGERERSRVLLNIWRLEHPTAL